MSEIILLAGGIGSGKAYIMSKKVQELKETGHSVALFSFADPIKKFIKDVFGLDKNGKGTLKGTDLKFKGFYEIFCDEFKMRNKANEMFQSIERSCRHLYENALIDLLSNGHSQIKCGLRTLMQIVGTEIAQSFNKEFWPSITVNHIQNVEERFHYFIIDDWRFIFEYFNILRKLQNTSKITPYYITASEETRAKRRNITVEELKSQSSHPSETESENVIRPFMEIYFPNNIIYNED